VETVFNSEKMTKRRLPRNRKTVVQPLGTNAERETETQGMMHAMLNFEKQMGLDETAMEGNTQHIFSVENPGDNIELPWEKTVLPGGNLLLHYVLYSCTPFPSTPAASP
jgi:hypothetical protein